MGIGSMDVNSPWKLFDLTCERDGPAAVPLADFKAEQLVVPPGCLSCVRMFTAPGDGNQVVPTEEQQVAIRDALSGVGERYEMWLFGRRHV